MSPLAGTFERLAALDPFWIAEIGVPRGEDWFRLDRVSDGFLPDWLDELADRHGGQRDVAASYLGGWLAGAAITLPVAALVLERRLPDPGGPVWAHRHADGWFDRVAFPSPRVLVEPCDPAVDHEDAMPVEEPDMLERYAAGLVELLTPVLDAIRSLAPYGRRGLWGGVADELTAAALWAARTGDADPDLAWRTADALVDAVAARTPWPRARPRPFPVVWSGGTALFPVKGTCCLFHKTQPQPPDPCGESYCTACPFRPDHSRHDRLVAYLDSHHDRQLTE